MGRQQCGERRSKVGGWGGGMLERWMEAKFVKIFRQEF
jgi:hypothetical protein